jgi:hypothetical protein
MRLRRCLAAAVLMVAVTALSARPADGPDGNWLLAFVTPVGETPVLILKAEHTDGGLKLAVAAEPTGVKSTLQDVKVAGKEVSFTLKRVQQVKMANGDTRDLTITQAVTVALGADGKSALGSMGDDRTQTRVKLTRTDKAEFDAKGLAVRGPAADAWDRVTALGAKANSLFLKYQREKDADAKKELVKEINAAQKEANDKAPAVFREVIESHPDTPAATDAALNLLRSARQAKLTADEAAKLVAVAQKGAGPYGRRYSAATLGGVADALVMVKGLEKAALAAVEPVAAALTDADPAATRSRVLTTLKTALEKTGNADRAKEVQARLEKLETILDAEYLASVPPFKPTKYTGRKDPAASRVAVLELFTGAQCPPCVAADVAFDALQKAYPATDLVLIQYHLHIPGPDPLTNAETETRAKYYGVRSTPSTLFNGKLAAAGGGGMPQSETKFGQYREVIDPILEKGSDVKLAGEAKRAGDTVSVTVEVAGLNEPGEKVKLRLVLVEETVKYVGSNGLRFHHQVVRDLIGGADGVPVAKLTAGKHTASVHLAKLKDKLAEYLDDFAVARPFPNPNRPLDLKGLRVIALVQDDESKEILQAAQFEVGGN